MAWPVILQTTEKRKKNCIRIPFFCIVVIEAGHDRFGERVWARVSSKRCNISRTQGERDRKKKIGGAA